MPKLEQLILNFLTRNDYKPVRRDVLFKKLKLSKKLLAGFQEALDSLVSDGKVREGKKGKLRIRSTHGTMIGIMRRTSSGAGFVIPEDPNPDAPPRSADVYVAPHDIHDAHTGDEVSVQLLKRRRSGGQRCGRVEEVLTRATSTFVGRYFEQDDQGWVLVAGKNFNDPIYVGDPGAKGAIEDDMVVVEMIRFPMPSYHGEAVITQVLGPRGTTAVDTQSIIAEFGLPHVFPEEVLEEARLQTEQFSDTVPADRRDLTKETIITIDPVDARDFDDAISLTRTDDGHWHLGVHIADVAHYVQPGSALDKEAYNRGTSVYLPQHVIPMLPEVLSNGLASLQKGKLRFTKSAFIEFSAEGVPLHTDFANTAINVTRRFAYEEVMPIIAEPEKHKKKVSAKVLTLMQNMHELAMLLRGRRFKAGALELHLPEIVLDFDSDGQVSGAHEAHHDESHEIIEEFMLAANIAVATEFNDRQQQFLRRAHGSPSLVKLNNFSQFTSALGYPLENPQSRFELQELINNVRGTRFEHAINYALLRSMKAAEYTSLVIGHYALATENYCHFTSPIRRYPDLTIHRLIDDVLFSPNKKVGADASHLTQQGRHCSNTERRAAAAERELKKIKLLTYIEQRVDEELDAVITGVESFGIFCQGVDVPVEGMIHISALAENDYFDHDPTTFTITGRRTGREYRLGDPIRVAVALVDMDRRQLEFRVVADSESGNSKSGSKPKRSANKKSRAKGQGGKRRNTGSQKKTGGSKGSGRNSATNTTTGKKVTKKKSNRKKTTRKKSNSSTAGRKKTARKKGAQNNAQRNTAKKKPARKKPKRNKRK